MKILIEVRGGVIQNIVTTQKIDIFIVDHDKLKEENEITRLPDTICSPSNLLKELSYILEPYEKKL